MNDWNVTSERIGMILSQLEKMQKTLKEYAVIELNQVSHRPGFEVEDIRSNCKAGMLNQMAIACEQLLAGEPVVFLKQEYVREYEWKELV